MKDIWFVGKRSQKVTGGWIIEVFDPQLSPGPAARVAETSNSSQKSPHTPNSRVLRVIPFKIPTPSPYPAIPMLRIRKRQYVSVSVKLLANGEPALMTQVLERVEKVSCGSLRPAGHVRLGDLQYGQMMCQSNYSSQSCTSSHSNKIMYAQIRYETH
jgi:hypothetical protein